MEIPQVIEQESNDLILRATDYIVTSDEEYESAGAFISGCKQLIKRIKEEFAGPKAKADEAHKAVCAMENRLLEKPTRAMAMVSDVAIAYKKEQDRLAREEKERIEALRRKEEEERRLAEAAALEEQGHVEEAEKVIAAPMPSTYRFVSPMPKVSGLATRKTWKVRVIDAKAVTLPYLSPDERKIKHALDELTYRRQPTDAEIKRLETEIGGVEIYLDETFAGARTKG